MQMLGILIVFTLSNMPSIYRISIQIKITFRKSLKNSNKGKGILLLQGGTQLWQPIAH